MSSTTVQVTAVQTEQPKPVRSAKPHGSVARWIKVDGRLVCKWFPAES
jgi:hypothetical protein